MKTADYYGRKIAQRAVSVDDGTLGELIADAAEDADAELDWNEQGEIHEDLQLRIEEAARRAAEDELRGAIEGR